MVKYVYYIILIFNLQIMTELILQQKSNSISPSIENQVPKVKVAVWSTQLNEQAEISAMWQKLIDFFRIFRNDPEKIAVFQSSLLDAKNVLLKQEFDKVLPIIIKESQDDPNSELSKNLQSMKNTPNVQLDEDQIDIAVTKAVLWKFSQELWIPKTDNNDILKSVSSIVKLAMPDEYIKVREQMKSLNIQKEIEICVLCWWTRSTCGWYKKHWASWPYFIKFQLNTDWTISQK